MPSPDLILRVCIVCIVGLRVGCGLGGGGGREERRERSQMMVPRPVHSNPMKTLAKSRRASKTIQHQDNTTRMTEEEEEEEEKQGER